MAAIAYGSEDVVRALIEGGYPPTHFPTLGARPHGARRPPSVEGGVQAHAEAAFRAASCVVFVRGLHACMTTFIRALGAISAPAPPARGARRSALRAVRRASLELRNWAPIHGGKTCAQTLAHKP